MLSTQQSIREQVDALTSTIYTHLSTISQESKVAIKKAEDGDQSVNADQVVSHLVRNLTTDLHQHDQVKSSSEVVSVEYGSQITPGDFPQESSEEVKEVQLTQVEKILQQVQSQDKEAKQIVNEMFEIYERIITETTNIMIDQKKQIEQIESNCMLQKSSSQRSQLIKSTNSLLLEQGSDFPQNLVNNLDNSMREFVTKQLDRVNQDVDKKTLFIDKYLKDLKKSSLQAVDYLLTLKKPETIVTRWTEWMFNPGTEIMFNTGTEMNLIHPSQSQIDKIKELDGQSLNEIALNKIWCSYNIGLMQTPMFQPMPNVDLICWNFEFKENKNSNFNQSSKTLQAITLKVDKKIKSIKLFAHQTLNLLAGIQSFDQNGVIIDSIGICKSYIKTLDLQEGEQIIGVKACKDISQPNTLGDIKFLVGKVKSD